MSRYIDADELIKTISSTKFTSLGANDILVTCCQIVIDNAPTADVRENVKGEWKEVAESGLCDLRRCSNCGHIEAVGLEIITPKPNYCPYCGADMRGEA